MYSFQHCSKIVPTLLKKFKKNIQIYGKFLTYEKIFSTNVAALATIQLQIKD